MMSSVLLTGGLLLHPNPPVVIARENEDREPSHPFDPMFAFVAKFTELTDVEREIMARACTIRHHAKNQWISLHLEEDPLSYFVLKGTVVLVFVHGDRESVSEIFVEGEPVLTSLSSPTEGGSHRLKCLEDCTIAATGTEESERLVEEFPRFGTVCRRFAEERLQRSLSWNERLRVMSPEEKYELLLQERRHLAQRVPQHVLASYLGITPETLSRLRKRIASR